MNYSRFNRAGAGASCAPGRPMDLAGSHRGLRPGRRRGFALLEVMIAVLIMGFALMFLLQIRNQTISSFAESGDQHTAAWLAELKMNEIMSQDLPDPDSVIEIRSPRPRSAAI